MSLVRVAILCSVLLVFFDESRGRHHHSNRDLIEKELRELKELEALLDIQSLKEERRDKTVVTRDNAEDTVIEAFEKGIEMAEKFKRKQKEFKASGSIKLLF